MFPKSGSKYGAVRQSGFASKLEASTYQILCLREKAGEIKDIRCQHTVDLGFGVSWKIDFSFTRTLTGETVFAESKGFQDPVYKLKLRMWKHGAAKGLLEIWGGSWQKPVLVEIIKP